MDWLRRPIRLGLQARITALTVLGLLAVFAVIGLIGLRNQAASMDVVLQQRVALAETLALHVEHHVVDPALGALAAATTEPGFDLTDADLAPEQAALAELYREGTFTYDVFVADARGVVLAVEPESLRAVLVGADLSAHPHVRRALETGQPQVSGLISGVAVSGPLVSLVVPLKNANGEITGLIGGALDPGGAAISGFIGPMALGETGYAQVVDGQGIVIASTIPGAAGAPSQHHDLLLSLIQRNEPMVATDVPVTEEGKEFHEVIAFAPIARLGWAVAIEQDRAEALAPVIQARDQILLWAAIALALTMPLVWFTTRQVTRPVLALIQVARRIGAGDLSTPVVVAGPDEVVELGRNLEAMRRKLVAWGEELEVAVRQRTRQLSVLYSIDRAAAQSLELDEILNDALDRVLEVLEVEAGGIFLLEPDGETMTLRVHRGLSDEFVENIRRIRLGEGISGRAAAERQPVVLDVGDYPTERLAPVIIQAGFQTLASTPLLSAGELVGALNVGTRRPRAFPPEEMELLTSIGQQLGGAVANARLHQETRQRAERLSILNRIAHALSTTLNLDELLEIVHREIVAVVEADTFFIALYDGEANELDFRIRIDKGVREPPERRPMAAGLTAAVVTSKQPLLIRDFEREKDHLPSAKLWGTMEAPQSWLGLPLLLGQDVIGVFSVQAYRPGAFDEADQQVLSTIADAVAVAVENTRLYEAERRRAARLDAMQRLGIELAGLRDESSVLTALVTRAAALADSPTCTVMLVDETTDEAVLTTHYGLPEDTPPGLRIPLTLPLIRRSLESGEPILLADTYGRNAVEMRAILGRSRPDTLRGAFFAYPMVWEGRALGFITLSSLAPHRPSAEEVTAYRLLAERAAAALVNARLHMQAQQNQAQLRESQERYRALFEDSPIALWEEDFSEVKRQIDHLRKEGVQDFREYFARHPEQIAGCAALVKIVDVNQAALRLHEAGSKEELLAGLALILGEEAQPTLAEELAVIAEGKPVFESEFVEWTLNGHKKNVVVKLSVAPGYEETWSKVLVSVVDITERKRIEEALRASEQEYRTLVENATELIWTLDREGRFTFVNRQAEVVSGQKLEDWLGKSFASLIAPPEDLPRIQRVFLKTLAGAPQSYEVGVYRPDGSIFYLSVNTTPLYRDGQVIGVISFGRDVTAEKEAEAALQQRERYLSQLATIGQELLRGDVQAVMPRILTGLGRTAGVSRAYVFRNHRDADGRLLISQRFEWTDGQVVPQIDNPALQDFPFDELPRWVETLGRGGLIAGAVREFPAAERAILDPQDILSLLVIPVFVGGEWWGFIGFDDCAAERAWQVVEQEMLHTAASLIGQALERARLFDETQQRMAELSSLFEVSSTLRGVEGVERMLPVIVDKAVESCRADCGNVLLLDESGELLVCRYGTGARQALVGARLRLDQGISGRVAQSGAAHLSPDFQHDPLLAFGPATSARLPEIASDVCVPLRVGEQIVGAMHVSTYTPRTCTEAELRLLTAIADMAASAIRRAGLLEQLEHRVHELSALFDVGKMATASLHIEDVLQFVAGAVTEAVHAEGSYVFLWDERVERLALRASQGFLAEDVGRMKFRPGEGLGGWVFLEGRTVNAPDLAADPRWKRDPHHEAPLPSGQANNALVVPLVAGKKTLGVLGVINKIGAPAFTASDESLLSTLAGQVAIAIENARLYEDVRGLSVAAIRSLATAIDARDPYTSGHSEDVAHLAVQLARELGWSGADLEMLEFAALLHDVGKIAVPDAILQKAKPLTPDEWNIIHLHPYHSAQIVKPIEPLQRIVPWVYHHQERWDGTGYPDGLKGEAIPLASRIIAVADAFNAMTTDRPYRKALPLAEALAEIERGAGGQFDPQLAEAFLRLMDRK